MVSVGEYCVLGWGLTNPGAESPPPLAEKENESTIHVCGLIDRSHPLKLLLAGRSVLWVIFLGLANQPIRSSAT